MLFRSSGGGTANGSGLLDSAGDLLQPSQPLQSATEALFGGASNAANVASDSGGGFMNELSNVFSSNSSSGIVDATGSVLSDVGGDALTSVGSGALDVAGDVASSTGEGLVDLVSDGLGSLLGSLFD